MKYTLSVGFACLVLLAACGKTHDEGLQGGETNWLSACEDESTCGVGSCVCEVCSESCDDDDDCPDGLVCRGPATELVRNSCGESERGLCAPECTRDQDCGDGQICGDGAACTIVSSDAGVSAAPYEAFSIAAVSPNAACEVSPDGPLVPIGLFDVASGAAADSESCDDPYRIHLVVANAGEDIVQVLGTRVRLLSRDQRPIVFNREEQELPNPFDFTSTTTLLPPDEGEAATRGFITVEVIPAAYAQQLDRYDGTQILAEITVDARDASDAVVAVPTFFYPIDLCVGCLSVCLNADVVDQSIDPAEIYGDSCPDDSGQDGRMCIDPDC